jgi:hypothetical protein
MSKFRVGEIVTVKHDLKSGQPFGDKFNVQELWNRRADGWIPAGERLPDADEHMVLAIVSGKPYKNITLHGAYMLAEYSEKEGWILESYPEWEDAEVTHWMPLPAPPKGEKP